MLGRLLARVKSVSAARKKKPSYLSCLILIQEQRVSHELKYQRIRNVIIYVERSIARKKHIKQNYGISLLICMHSVH
jgi:hypothetical protein